MGKRPLVRRRRRGGLQFRVPATGNIAPGKYPSFELSENHEGEIIDLVHERGRDVPLAKVRFSNGSISFLPAVMGAKVGSHIHFGLRVVNFPEGSFSVTPLSSCENTVAFVPADFIKDPPSPNCFSTLHTVVPSGIF